VWFAVPLGTALLLAFVTARSGKQHRLATIYLLLAVAAFGAGWSGRLGLAGPDDVGHLAGPLPAPVILRAVLDDEPRRTPAPADADPLRSQQEPASAVAVVRVLAAVTPYGEEPRSGRVRVSVGGEPGQHADELLAGLHPGDEVEVSGRLEAVTPPGNPGEFDRAAWAAGRGIRARLRARPGAVRLLEPGFTAWGVIGALRTRAHAVIDRAVPATTAPLARALLLGEGAPMRREDWGRYLRTGVVHVLAISGQHLVVLAAFLWWALRRAGLRQRHVAVAVAVTLIGYALLTGARPPALRAAVIAGAACAAVVLVRAVNAVNLAALAWLAVGVWHPPDLADVGCQLSFWAACVLAWGVAPLLDREMDPIDRLIVESRPPPLRLLFGALDAARTAFVAGAVAWLLITPLVAYHTGGLAPAALVLGPPLALLTSVALVAGFLLLLLAWVPGLSAALALAVHLPLAGCDWLVGVADRWSLFVALDPVPGWWIVGLLLGLTAYAARPVRPGWPVAAALLWAVALLAAWNVPSMRRGLTVTFLDVGHGGATLLELPCGRAVLYDAGSLRGPAATESVAGFLAARGVRRLDDVILSHADLDHFNALPGLMDRVAVGRVLVSPTFAKKPSAGVRYTMGRLGSTAVATLQAGDRLESGAVAIDVLHPPGGWERGDENARSLVLHVRHGPHAVLLTGDLSGDGLAALLATPPRRADVLMAPHHGSRRVDLPALARWCRPRLVVSCQAPRDERPVPIGVPVWETGRSGAVTVTSDRGLRASAFRSGAKLALVDAAGPPR
ncbi:MAG: ComEC/Rec2 family competence protein, partial [Gemmataceae bacterium]